MPARKRHRAQREQDFVTIAQMWAMGKPQHEIGDKLGLSQQMICHEQKVLQQRWQEAQVGSVHAMRQLELTRLEVVIGKAFDAYEESKELKALQVVLNATEQRCQLMGLHQPAIIKAGDSNVNHTQVF